MHTHVIVAHCPSPVAPSALAPPYHFPPYLMVLS